MGRNDAFNEFWELLRTRNGILQYRYLDTSISLPCDWKSWPAAIVLADVEIGGSLDG